MEKAGEMASKGAEVIACVAVNDPFVMGAWGETSGADGKVCTISLVVKFEQQISLCPVRESCVAISDPYVI